MVFQNSFLSFETIQNSIEVFKKLPLIKKFFFQLTSEGKKKLSKRKTICCRIQINKTNNMFACSYAFVYTLLYFHYLNWEIEFSFLNCFLWCESDFFFKVKKSRLFIPRTCTHSIHFNQWANLFLLFYKTLKYITSFNLFNKGTLTYCHLTWI